VGVAVEVVKFIGIADATERSESGGAGLFGGVEGEVAEKSALAVAFEEFHGFGEAEEPLVAIHGTVERKAIVGETAASACDGLTGGGPAVGERDDRDAARYAEEFGKNVVKVVEMFEDVGAYEGIEGAVLEGEAIDLLKVDLDVGGAADINADVVEGLSG